MISHKQTTLLNTNLILRASTLKLKSKRKQWLWSISCLYSLYCFNKTIIVIIVMESTLFILSLTATTPSPNVFIYSFEKSTQTRNKSTYMSLTTRHNSLDNYMHDNLTSNDRNMPPYREHFVVEIIILFFSSIMYTKTLASSQNCIWIR